MVIIFFDFHQVHNVAVNKVLRMKRCFISSFSKINVEVGGELEVDDCQLMTALTGSIYLSDGAKLRITNSTLAFPPSAPLVSAVSYDQVSPTNVVVGTFSPLFKYANVYVYCGMSMDWPESWKICCCTSGNF